MLRFLIISALIIYVISKIGSFFFRAGISSSQSRYQPPRQPNPPPSTPNQAKDRKTGTIKGGDYVDYEEVK